MCFVRHSGLWVWSLILRGRPCDCHVIVYTLSCDDICWQLVTEKRDEMLCWILFFSSTEMGRSETACQGTAQGTSQATTFTYMHTYTAILGLYTVHYKHGCIYKRTGTKYLYGADRAVWAYIRHAIYLDMCTLYVYMNISWRGIQ